MGADTKIEWAHHTFNPWIGCTAVSPACDHCYAERFAKRLGVAWGPHAERRLAAETTLKQPHAWNRKALREGKRARVFGPSLADPFDKQVSIAWLTVYLDIIRRCDAMDWLLLTKRPQLILARLRAALDDAQSQNHMVRWDTAPVAAWLQRWIDGTPPANVWLGTTVENQDELARRLHHLENVPAHRRFLSCEPLLSGLDFMGDLHAGLIHWVIAGGESGPGARPSNPQWFRDLRDQCAAADVPFLFKQWGEWVSASEVAGPGEHFSFPDHRTVRRVGKKVAGRLLDGVLHDGVPHA